MPQEIREMLISNLVACFEDQGENLREMCSSSEGRDFSFPALHFAWYNRHGTRVNASIQVSNVRMIPLAEDRLSQGHDVPVDAHPILIEKDDNTRTNYGQMLPYPSQDTGKYKDIYNNLQSVFQNLFEWMAEQVCGSIYPLN